MKKKIFIIASLFVVVLTGCELGNTPTSKVEDLLSRYQMLDDSIAISYVDLSQDSNIDNDLKKRYEALIKKQYQNLAYEVKEEMIDGDIATVTTQVEVVDYAKVIEKYDQNVSDDDYHEKVLKALESATEKVTYTIDFIVNKDEEGDWNVQVLSELEQDKLLGMNFESPAYT